MLKDLILNKTTTNGQPPAINIEILWRSNVTKAKEFIKAKQMNQMQIAALALEVCEISWGGAKLCEKYTLRRFSKEAGVPEKQLSTWIAVKKRVYDKLPPALQKDPPVFTRMLMTATRVSKDASPGAVEKELKALTDSSGVEYTLSKYLGSLRSASSTLTTKERSQNCPEDVLKEYLFYCSSIIKAIKKINPTLQPENLGIASKTSHKKFSAADALGITRNPGKNHGTILVKDSHGFEVRITEKDKQIMKYLRGKKKFYSPTELGMKLKGHNASSASAWAYRTLNKLQSLEYVERNNQGHYRWIAS